MLVTFIPYFTRFSVDLYLKNHLFLWFTMKKIVVFQLSHNTTPNQDKLRRFSSSVRGPKKAGEVRDDMSTSLILRSSNLYTDLGTRFMASIWWGWWIRIFSLTIWYNRFLGAVTIARYWKTELKSQYIAEYIIGVIGFTCLLCSFSYSIACPLFIGLAIKLPEIERSMWGRIKNCKNTRSEEHYSQILQSLSKVRMTN